METVKHRHHDGFRRRHPVLLATAAAAERPAHTRYLLSLTTVGEICLFVLKMSHHSGRSEGQRLSLEENILNCAPNTLRLSFCQVTNKTRHTASTSTR